MIRSLTVKRAQTLRLEEIEPAVANKDYLLLIKKGIVRLALHNKFTDESSTVGFYAENKLRISALFYEEFDVRIEALTYSELALCLSDQERELDPNCNCHLNTFGNWPLIMNMIVTSKSTSLRIERLICTLTSRFGFRRKEEYFLPFLLSHEKISNLLGCTRSTVTRYMLALREHGILDLSANGEGLIVSEELMNRHSRFCGQLID